jgi:hypothetical protein
MSIHPPKKAERRLLALQASSNPASSFTGLWLQFTLRYNTVMDHGCLPLVVDSTASLVRPGTYTTIRCH